MFHGLLTKKLKVNCNSKCFVVAVFGEIGYSLYNMTDSFDHLFNSFQVGNIKETYKKVKVCYIEEYEEESDEEEIEELNIDNDIPLPVIKVGIPVKPMLCKPVRDLNFVENTEKSFSVEVKYDGERIMIHRNENGFKSFSRTLKNTQDHKFKFVLKVLKEKIKFRCILDGELIVIDKQNGKACEFYSLLRLKKNKDETKDVAVVFFDILSFKGESLLHQTLQYRRKILEDNIDIIPQKIFLSERVICEGNDEINRKNVLHKFLDKIRSERQEGIVIKDLNSGYYSNKRKWLKFKCSQMRDSPDLVVVGGYSNQFVQNIRSYLLCCYDKTEGVFKSVCKVGVNSPNPDVLKLQNAFQRIDETNIPIWLNMNSSALPNYILRCNPFRINNELYSIVWEIEGYEITISSFHTSGFSIRFPKLKRVRKDKRVINSTSLEQLSCLKI